MASGDLLASFHPYQNEPPASNFGTLDWRNQHPVLDLDAGTDESIVFEATMPPNYSGGGIVVKPRCAATSATSGDYVLNSQIENLAGQDMDSDGFASAQAATTTTNGTSGIYTTTSIAHTSGGQMDSVTAGDKFRVKVTRDADNGSDTMTGDLEVRGVDVYEA